MANWQLQQAKAQLSKLVHNANQEGPQSITMHGKPYVVVLAFEDYQRLIAPSRSLIDIIRRSPLGNGGIRFARNRTKNRKIKS